MDTRELFLKDNIPYDDIDKELTELIYVLNYQLEFKTYTCCFGHDLNTGLSIGFEPSVDDLDMEDLAHFLLDKINVDFNKWLRSGDEIWINWFLRDPGNRFDCLEEFNEYKLDYVNNLVKHLKEYAEASPDTL